MSLIDRDPNYRALHEQLHKLWTASVGTPGYDKRAWQVLEQMLFEHGRRVEGAEERVKQLEGDLHDAIVREREAEAKAKSADHFILPVTDGLPGEIDVCSGEDGHSHRYVPTSSVKDHDCKHCNGPCLLEPR
jgi:hypothetical protein